jgi:hypothetical protein
MADKPNPHKSQEWVDVNTRLRSEFDLDARPRKKRTAAATDELFAGFAIMFHEEWNDSRPVDYLRWSAAQMAVAAPVLRRSAKLMNAVIIEKVMFPIVQIEIKPVQVLRYIVRHWRVFRLRLRLRGESPLPENITAMCKHRAGEMDDQLLGLFGYRSQMELQDRTRQLDQRLSEVREQGEPLTYDREVGQIMVDMDRREIWLASKRLVEQVPWLQDDDFLDALSGEQIGRRRQATMH